MTGRPVTGRVLRRARELALDAAALVGTLGLLLVLAGVLLDVRPLVFRSGSMAPAIDTGALALARTVPAADLRVGDVVSVLTASGERVTHRVVDLAAQGEARQVTLRGDANRAVDREVPVLTEADRVLVSVPRLGYLLGWAGGPAGLLLLGAYAAYLLSVLVRGRRYDDDADPPADPPAPPPAGRRRAEPARGRRRATAPSRGRHAAPVAAMTVLALAVPAPASAAPWTETAAVTGSVLTAHSVAPPDSTTCDVSSPSVTIAWPEKSTLYDYEVVLKRSNGTVVSTSQVTGAAVGKAFTATADFGFGLLAVGTFDFTVEIRSYLAATTSWGGATVKVADQQIRISVVLALLVPVLDSVSCV